MAKGKVSVTIDHAVLEAADADAQAAGLNRPEIFERALRNEHLRRSLTNYTTHTVPTLNIDAYAHKVYGANRGRWPVIIPGDIPPVATPTITLTTFRKQRSNERKEVQGARNVLRRRQGKR